MMSVGVSVCWGELTSSQSSSVMASCREAPKRWSFRSVRIMSVGDRKRSEREKKRDIHRDRDREVRMRERNTARKKNKHITCIHTHIGTPLTNTIKILSHNWRTHLLEHSNA